VPLEPRYLQSHLRPPSLLFPSTIALRSQFFAIFLGQWVRGSVQRDWYFIAEQPAPAPHLAHPEGLRASTAAQVVALRAEQSPAAARRDIPDAHPERHSRPQAVRPRKGSPRILPLFNSLTLFLWRASPAKTQSEDSAHFGAIGVALEPLAW